MGILTYIKIGVIVLAFVAGGWAVHRYYKPEIQNLKMQAEVAKANLATAEKTIKVLKEFQDVDQAIQNAPDDDVAEYLRTGVYPKHPQAGDSPATLAPKPDTGKPKTGQK